MDNKWTVMTAIGASLLSVVGAIYATEDSGRNSIRLETLKLKAKDLADKREFFYRRCDAMNALFTDLSSNTQALYYGGDLEAVVSKYGNLKSKIFLAKSYLGEDSLALYNGIKERIEEQEREDEDVPPESEFYPSIAALAEELTKCNGPSSLP